jgi:nucleotidyltransferase substrate binding protein (TIGR01987 family)
MATDIRWQQRFENLDKTLHSLRRALSGLTSEPDNDLYQMALMLAFQLTFELAWKTLKDYLVHSGVHVSFPRDVIKQAFHHRLIRDGQVWIDMLKEHNLMAHVSQEGAALEAVKNIRTRYAPAIEEVYNDLLSKRSA